jgi:hypothetical protein
MAKAKSVLSTPPTNTPIDTTRRRFLTVAAGASVVSVGTLAVAAMPATAPDSPACVVDPIYEAIKRHKQTAAAWDAAVDVRSNFNDFDMTEELREQRDELDDAIDVARDALNKTGIDLISTVPTTVGGITSAIAYIQRQMRDSRTFMPFDIEFHFDVGYEGGDGAVVFGWIDAFLNMMAVAVADLYPAGKAVQA